MDSLTIKTTIFEGPLDLLLFLIKKMEIEVTDIPIVEIVEQYMAYVETMKKLELAVVGEYLVMAATLLSIKSAFLLPQHAEAMEDEIEEEDPRQELVNMLIEYQTFKQVAVNFSEKEQQRQAYFTKAPDELTDFQEEIPLKPGEVTLFDLLVAFQHATLKMEYKKPRTKTIQRESMTVSERITWIKKRLLESSHPLLFSDLIVGKSTQELVVSFLALLELMKENQVRVQQKTLKDELVVSIHPL